MRTMMTPRKRKIKELEVKEPTAKIAKTEKSADKQRESKKGLGTSEIGKKLSGKGAPQAKPPTKNAANESKAQASASASESKAQASASASESKAEAVPPQPFTYTQLPTVQLTPIQISNGLFFFQQNLLESKSGVCEKVLALDLDETLVRVKDNNLEFLFEDEWIDTLIYALQNKTKLVCVTARNTFEQFMHELGAPAIIQKLNKKIQERAANVHKIQNADKLGISDIFYSVNYNFLQRGGFAIPKAEILKYLSDACWKIPRTSVMLIDDLLQNLADAFREKFTVVPMCNEVIKGKGKSKNESKSLHYVRMFIGKGADLYKDSGFCAFWNAWQAREHKALQEAYEADQRAQAALQAQEKMTVKVMHGA